MSVQGMGLDFLADIKNAIPRVFRYILIIAAYTLLQYGMEQVADHFGYSISKWGEMAVAFVLAALYAVRREQTY